MGYDSINERVLEQVPSRARRVLDVGCGIGSLGQVLKQTIGCSVVGVTIDESEAATARTRLDSVVLSDLNSLDVSALGTFDCIVCCHVLEHLYRPDVVLQRLLSCLNPDGTMVVALPNVLFWRQRLAFLRGRFQYTDGWIMDRTHYRFFDWNSAQELLSTSGYVIEAATAQGHLPLSRWLPRSVGERFDRMAVGWLPGVFGWQFVLRCRLDSANRPNG